MIVISYEAFQLLLVTGLVFALMIGVGTLTSISRRLLAERRHRAMLVVAAQQKWHRRKRGNSW